VLLGVCALSMTYAFGWGPISLLAAPVLHAARL